MTAIVVIGIELSARTQIGLLAAEIVTLALFAIVALVKVYAGGAPSGSVDPSLSWLNPFSLSPQRDLRRDAAGGLHLLGLGHDGDASTRRPRTRPRRRAGDRDQHPDPARDLCGRRLSPRRRTPALESLVENQEDVLSSLGTEVFGSPLDKLLIIAVLTSAAASTQTTILPAARTTLSMARAKAMPESLGKIHPRYLTPHISTLCDGRALDPLVRRPDPGQRRHPLRLARGAGVDDLVLHRDHRLRLRDLLPARAAAQRQELLLRRRRPGARRGDPLLPSDQERDRTRRPGQLGIGQLLVRARAAAGDRGLLPGPRRRADGAAVAGAARLLPAPDRRSRRPGFLEGEPSTSRHAAGGR